MDNSNNTDDLILDTLNSKLKQPANYEDRYYGMRLLVNKALSSSKRNRWKKHRRNRK